MTSQFTNLSRPVGQKFGGRLGSMRPKETRIYNNPGKDNGKEGTDVRF